MRVIRDACGFSLLEVAIAAAILLPTCLAVSTAVSAALGAGAHLDRVGRLESAVAAEAARLDALPYVRATPAPGAAGGGTETRSLLGELFPHALVAFNRPEACYEPGSGTDPAARFVSIATSKGVVVTRVACFLSSATPDGETLTAEVLGGWAVWTTETPPAVRLAVELTATGGGVTRRRTLLVDALRPTPASPAADAGGG